MILCQQDCRESPPGNPHGLLFMFIRLVLYWQIMMTHEDSKPWRKKILLDLQDRNRRQCDPFAEIIKSR